MIYHLNNLIDISTIAIVDKVHIRRVRRLLIMNPNNSAYISIKY